jgi:hypothetical protein
MCGVGCNIIVEYPGEPGGGVISFVGAHMVRELVCGELVGWRSLLKGWLGGW